MAFIERTIGVEPAQVWAALIDPHTYPEWLIGAKEIRAVDNCWPAPGSAFHHRVGIWPIHVDDKSIVRDVQPERRLVLEVRATLAIRGLVTFTLRPDDAGTHLSIEEEPLRRIIGNLVRPVLDPLTHMRNAASLARLDAMLVNDLAARS